MDKSCEQQKGFCGNYIRFWKYYVYNATSNLHINTMTRLYLEKNMNNRADNYI